MSRNRRGSWVFVLADAQGAALAELTTATGRQITYTRNSFAECQVTLSHEDADASLLLGALQSTGLPTLRVYRRSPFATSSSLVFNGYLAPFQEDAEEQATLTAVFRSPFARLLGDGSDRGRYTDANYTITPNGLTQDAAVIAADLLSVANTAGDTGLALGTTETTVQRERLYNYSNIGEAIQELTQVLDGFDFEEEFTVSGMQLAKLNIHARLGQDQPTAKFEYGPGTLANVRSMSRTTQPPINHVTLLGGNGLVAVKEDATSIVRYGLWPSVQSASDVTKQTILDAKALALLRPNPVRTIEFMPEAALENCPQAFEDYGVGDTIHFYAKRDALEEQVAARVNGMTIAISDDGFESAEISDPSSPEEQSYLRAQIAIESEDTGA